MQITVCIFRFVSFKVLRNKMNGLYAFNQALTASRIPRALFP